MVRWIVAIVSLGFCSLASAQVTTFSDVKAKNGVQLSAAELQELMPGAKVVSRTQAGSTRSWTNKPNGTFSASSDGRGTGGGRNAYGFGEGTWRVADNGRLCVTIQWNRTPEDWCRYIFKVDKMYYGVGRLDDNAPASEFEFSK
jgi:uncharacterized protein DUF995